MLGVETAIGPQSRFVNLSPQHGIFRALRDQDAHAFNAYDTISITRVYSGNGQRLLKRSPELSAFLIGETYVRAFSCSFDDVHLAAVSSSNDAGVSAWVSAMYDASLGPVEDDDILAMFDALEEAIYTDLGGLNLDLSQIEVHRLAPEFLVGVPRALFPLNDRLSNWQPYVLRAWRTLAKRKLDANELLQGLL